MWALGWRTLSWYPGSPGLVASPRLPQSPIQDPDPNQALRCVIQARVTFNERCWVNFDERRSRCSFNAILEIDANHFRPRGNRAAALNCEDRRRAQTELRPRGDGSRRQNSTRRKMRSRLSNGLPISGEGRTGRSMVPLPGPRGGRRSSVEPRGPGSSHIDRELTAFVRFIGLFDNGTAPSSCAGRRG